MSLWEPDFDGAVGSGLDPYDQAIRLWDLATKCHDACGKLSGRKMVDCDAACKGLERKAQWYSDNKSALYDAIEAGGGAVKPLARGQASSDRVYQSTYMAANGKSDADLDAAIQQLLDEIHHEGMTPARRAALDALADVRNGWPENPPDYNPGPFAPPVDPRPEEPEQPET